MTSVVSIEVDGLGTVPAQAEVTSQEVLNAYAVALAPIINAFNDSAGDPIQQYIDIGTSLTQLLTLANQGIFNPQTNRQEFVTVTMARQINQIIRSLNSVGYDPNVTPDPNVIPQWRDLADIGLRDILQGASNAIRYNRSLQAIIELEYVRTGNEQIFNNLSSLQENLQLTQDALTILERAQGLKNSISPPDADPTTTAIDALSPTAQALADAWDQGNLPALQAALVGQQILFTIDSPVLFTIISIDIPTPFCTVESFTQAYSQTLDRIFGHPLIPVVDADVVAPGIQPLTTAQENEFLDIREEIRRIVTRLDLINGTTPGDPGRQGTLAGRLDVLLQDMAPPSAGGNTNQELSMWILDSYDDPNNANSGNYQRNLTEAITTSQSINDQQRQELRRQLFVFEEFYRSASAILIAINQIINRMASNISR